MSEMNEVPEVLSENELKHFLFDDEEVTWKDKFDRLASGEYGAFEMWDATGDVSGYRGFRKNFGTTDVFPTYREAVEAALDEFTD